MIDSTSASQWSSAAGAYDERTSLGMNGFLTLLVTQLQNQDPLSPLEPHEFAAQLASFTSVEQLTQINAGLAEQADSLRLANLMNETSFSAALIGRRILAAGNQASVTASGPGEVEVEIGTGGGQGRLRVFDSSGQEVADVDLGRCEAGRQSIALPSDLEEGLYTYEVTVEDADGASVPVTSFTTGTVDGVSFSGGQVLLRLGEILIALETVVEINSASPAVPVPDAGDGSGVPDPEDDTAPVDLLARSLIRASTRLPRI